MDGSTVTVLLRVYAGIDVRATLDGRGPDRIGSPSPVLEFEFQNVAVGAHTVEVRDVVGYGETAHVSVPGTTTGPNGGSEELTLGEVLSDPDQYDGKDIVLTGFYLDGSETTVLSERLEPTGFAVGHLWPRGRMVWIENNPKTADVYDQLYKQDMIGPLERCGKLRIRGRFEHGGAYGHVGGFIAQFIPSQVELLPWSPAPHLAGYSLTDLKYLLIKHFGGVIVSEPVMLPDDIRREQARAALPKIRQDEEEFQTILDHIGLAWGSDLTDDQQLQVFEEKKKLNAVRVEPSEGGHSFGLAIKDDDRARIEVEGSLSLTGEISVLSRKPSPRAVCLPGGAGIDTPSGPVEARSLLAGMQVWTVDASGERVSAPVKKAASRPAPEGHVMVRVGLDDGRRLLASPGHPLADGRTLERLAAGDAVDGARVVSLATVPYEEERTYDILPGGTTGLYWADGVLVGSTLFAAPGCTE